MKKIGIVVKPGSKEAVKFAGEIAAWASARGAEVFVQEDDIERLDNATAVSHGDLPGRIEVLVVLGGDGTMLNAVSLVADAKIPVLGVNLGGLGFLTTTRKDELYEVLEAVINGDIETEERMMLSVSLVRDDKEEATFRVLNDAIIRTRAARLVRLETSINREYVTTYRADGLIVATPTGSTAYSLSADGPILYPTIHSITVTPICPFNHTNRPMVIPDWMEVEVRLSPRGPEVDLTLDGRVDKSLQGGDLIRIKRAETSVNFVKYRGKSYFEILRERLMWECRD